MNRIRKQGDSAFFVFPDGESISIEDTDRVLMRILEVRTDEIDIARAFWDLAQDCLVQDCNEAGGNYIRTAVQFSRDGTEAAKRCLFLGLLMEQRENFEAAAVAYSEALQLTPSRNDTWYSIYNNLGYSLIRCGRCREAESYCRAACDIDPHRHNAVRNLGLAIQGQGRYHEAARAFMNAMNLCPDDLRAYVHIEDLLYNHEEIASDMPDMIAQVEKCKERVMNRGDRA
ncbi:MAG TPA: tetratricopeptide repeat protein [Syntrophales bacterium]|nr:tetratricopeptide repeat protein [Syntrophales bacterium]